MLTVEDLEQAESLQTIIFPLIVPSKEEVLNSKNLDLSKSALNACYSKPAIDEESGELKSWFDVEITVDGNYDLPPKEKWFYIITDDGCGFKARFSGKKVKKLSSFEDREIIGRWIKGRLVETDCVYKFQFVCQDPKKWGVITKEMLKDYGGDKLVLKKTNITKKDGRGKERDVWFLSFPFTIDLNY